MRRSNPMMAMSLAATLALCVQPVHADNVAEGERKTPPPEPTPPEPSRPVAKANLPGETNRQFAARMRAAITRADGGGALRASAAEGAGHE